MFRINRLRVEITTIDGVYGIDETFNGGLNFIASRKNTCGKSSILHAVYYCLGLEQIIGGAGGTGHKVLTSVFNSNLDDEDRSLTVTESGAYLEINNGSETIAIYRNIKSENQKNPLVKVYYSPLSEIGNPKTQSIDYYVNVPYAATNDKGFHAYLESFLHLELPKVNATNGGEQKLYIQMIFASMFIEQKHGWSGIMSGIPQFGIRESKKRVVEFVLNLDCIKIEKEKERLKSDRAKIENDWRMLLSDIQRESFSATCNHINFPLRPRVLKDDDYKRMAFTTGGEVLIKDEISRLNEIYESLRKLKPRVSDNFEELNKELSETHSAIYSLESELNEIIRASREGGEAIQRLTSSLQIINSDIRNNEDAARLQKFGSEAAVDGVSVDVCPTCKQGIQDNLLFAGTETSFMNIDDNIRHLKEQKKMLEFSLKSHKHNQEEQMRNRELIESKLQTLRRLAQALRSDLHTTTDEEISETIVMKKIQISQRIERLTNLEDYLYSRIAMFKSLSDRWNKFLDEREKLPPKSLSDLDYEKIELLKSYFISNLKCFNYSSIMNIEGIEISEESLMPTIDGFDMKFGSSASDGIRLIWAFTAALLKVSLEKEGNHPGVVIFDEPAQHSIVSEDMKNFFTTVAQCGENSQVITSITLNSDELITIVDELEDAYHKINIKGRAFKLLE